MNKLITGLVIIILGYLFSCDKSPTKSKEIPEPSWKLSASVFPDIGTSKTKFQPEVSIIENGDTSRAGSGYKLSFEYDNDILPKTDWLDSIPPTPPYSSLGKHTIKIIVKDSIGAIDTTSVDIYVQELIQITPTNYSGSAQGNIDWSKDGTNRIAFDWRPETGEHMIYIVQYPGGTPVSVTPEHAHFPEWSPDGNRIAYDGIKGIDIINLTNGKIINLPEKMGLPYAYSWSPDGRWLFCGDYNSRTVIYDFDRDTTLVFFNSIQRICWSPDGTKIATVRFESWEEMYLQIMDFESRQILKEYSIPYRGYKLDWSQSGRWISLGFDYRNNAGFILDIETGRAYSWTPGNLVAVWYPSWSEDGSLLAFEALEEIEGTDTWTSIWAITFPEELR